MTTLANATRTLQLNSNCLSHREAVHKILQYIDPLDHNWTNNWSYDDGGTIWQQYWHLRSKLKLLTETPYLVLCAQAFAINVLTLFDCWQNIVQFDLRHLVERTLMPLCFLHSVPNANFCSSLCRSWLISHPDVAWFPWTANFPGSITFGHSSLPDSGSCMMIIIELSWKIPS